MNSQLRFTDTNSSTDSSGKTWGLDGNLVWWLIGGLGTGIVSFFILITLTSVSLLNSVGLALAPILVVVGYILLLRQGKPPGYDVDLLDLYVRGRGFSPQVGFSEPHPFPERK